jgi:hypothetical protein
VLRGSLIAVLLVLAGTPELSAQEFQPRTYSITPVGVNYVGLGYGFSSGNVLLDPSIPIEDLDANLHILFARYTRSLSLFNRATKLKVLLPWSSGDWKGIVDGELGRRKDRGFGDVRFALETVLFGGRAMAKADLSDFKPRTVGGARVLVIVPTGDYDSQELVNLGSNRWTFIPEVGLAQTLGPWTLEGAASAWFFAVNDDFLEGNKLKQNPLFVAKIHIVRTYRRGIWWVIGVGYGYGGRSNVNGVPRATLQQNLRLTAGLTYPVTARSGVSLALTSGRNAGAGSDFDGVALAYQTAF